MKSPEAAIRELIITTPPTSQTLGTGVYPLVAPTSADYPFAIYRRTGVQREATFTGPMGTPNVSMDLTVLAVTYEEAREAANQCRELLDNYSGVVGDVILNQVVVDNEQDDFIQLEGTELPPSYSVTLSLEIIWYERN